MFLKKNVIIYLEEYIYILKKVLKYLSDDCTLCRQKNFSKSRPTCTFNTQTTARRGIFLVNFMFVVMMFIILLS